MLFFERVLVNFSVALALLGSGCSDNASPMMSAGPTAMQPQPSAAGNPALVSPVATPAAGSGGAPAPVAGMPETGAGAPAMPSVGGASAPVAGAGGTGAPAAGSGGVSYHKDIRPILESYCVGCHVAGGMGGFPLDSWMAVKSPSATVVGAVTSGIMPPPSWKDDCEKPQEVRLLTPEQRALFTQWKDGGFLEGSELEYTSPSARMQKILACARM